MKKEWKFKDPQTATNGIATVNIDEEFLGIEIDYKNEWGGWSTETAYIPLNIVKQLLESIPKND